ncbi:MAG: FAD-dependent oxidoreductase, partial [Nitrospira sp.]|nr:FAD-dependent oxidoreductase [Nitrospira sp.]
MAHYDLLVIGTGPAGQKAAVQAAKLGKKVGLIERKEVVGGVCINSGTIPSKALREAVLYFSGIPQRSIYGTPYRLKEKVTIQELALHANYVIKNEIKIVHDQMARNRVDMLFGSASFLDPHRLLIQHRSGPTEHTADFIVIAVGTEPSRPPEIPFDDTSVIDTDGLLTLKHLPSSIVIVGGGVIGTEYASMLAALGVPTTLIDKRPRLLEFVDAEIIDRLQQQMKELGVILYHDEEVLSIKRGQDNSIDVCLQHAKPIQASTLMYAIGRVGAT